VLKFEYLYKSGKYVHHSFAFGKNLNAYYYVRSRRSQNKMKFTNIFHLENAVSKSITVCCAWIWLVI